MSLKDKRVILNEKKSMFLISIMKYGFNSFVWGSSFDTSLLKMVKISLPIRNDNTIDFDFMDTFISELEAYHISELEAYLKASGLKDYKLTKDEIKALDSYSNNEIELFEVEFKDIFENIKQGRRLKKEDHISGDIPFIMAGVTNTGVANYISNPIVMFPKNSITIDIFGNCFYRDYEYSAGDDNGVYWSDKNKYNKLEMLYFTTSMQKFLNGKYSYGKKLRSSQSLKFKMMVPMKNNNIDYEFMKNLISAVEKLIIKDVVLYSKRKIYETKKVIS